MTFGMGLLAAGAQMQGEAELLGQGARLVIVEALVEAEVLGCRRGVCWKWSRCLQRDDGIGSGSEVNAAFGGRLTEALPAINLAHADLA